MTYLSALVKTAEQFHQLSTKALLAVTVSKDVSTGLLVDIRPPDGASQDTIDKWENAARAHLSGEKPLVLNTSRGVLEVWCRP